MSATPLDGRLLAADIQKNLAARAAALRRRLGRRIKLAIVLAAGGDAAASSYVKAKLKACAEVGIEADASAASAAELGALLAALAADPAVDAVVVDRPMPAQADAAAVAAAIPEGKDAEGLAPANFGRLFLAKTYAEIENGLIAPCTARAVAELLRATRVPLSGKRAVVVGRSAILGRPAAHLLSALDLTVTLCHAQTRDLAGEVGRADVVVACLGKPGLIQGSWIKRGAVVIDAGVNVVSGKLRGDVDPAAAERAAYLTPVPGGVGPVTTAMLLANALTLAERAL